MPVYWGILHCHVDGGLCHKQEPFTPAEMDEFATQVDQLYDFAIQDRQFDFLFYADHHNQGQMIALGDTPESPWHTILQKARERRMPGQFAALLGYEFQDGMEYNVYLHDTDQLPLADTWPELIAQVEPGDPGILLAAHNRPAPTDWQFPRHPNFRLIEVLNDGSVFEHWANEGLQHGHRAAFIAGSDDHSCRPGCNACTGVWADELTEDAIWRALYQGRTVAARGIRAELFLEVNDQPMGSETDPASSYRVQLSHRFERPPLRVFLISAGRAVAELHSATAAFDMTIALPADRIQPGSYLYAKCLYEDGKVALTSPVFIRAGAERQLPASTPTGTATAYQAERDIGTRIGRHRFINAGGLVSPAQRPMQQVRDMVIHAGPDGLLVLPNGACIVPTMAAISQLDPDGRTTPLHTFAPDEGNLVLPSYVQAGDAVFAAGYLADSPQAVPLIGELPPAWKAMQPVPPYLYRDRWVTPGYLAGDGDLLCCLASREATILLANGTIVGFCQEGYPSFPVAVDMAGLDRIAIVSCDGHVAFYDASAAQDAPLLWDTLLPETCVATTIIQDEVWCYSAGFRGCYSRDPLTVHALDVDTGSLLRTFELDLVNIRGTRIGSLPDGCLVAQHNPCLQGAAVDRDRLNETGTLRVFRPVPGD
ncbi:MAG: hypothetical protein HN904_00110 [Victivallales bacterium]|nr:hypothetical protein [Victivallales bacterium]